MPWTTVGGMGRLPSGIGSEAERGLRRCSLSSLMLWPWLARISQWAGSVVVSEREGLVTGLGFRAKRCLSLSRTAERMSGKVGARERMGGYWS